MHNAELILECLLYYFLVSEQVKVFLLWCNHVVIGTYFFTCNLRSLERDDKETTHVLVTCFRKPVKNRLFCTMERAYAVELNINSKDNRRWNNPLNDGLEIIQAFSTGYSKTSQ